MHFYNNGASPHSPLEDDQFVEMAHVQCEGSTLLEDYSEEIPKLIRVFCGLDSAQQSNHQDCIYNGFDYKAATELLRREPTQVKYATYECRKRRRNSLPEKDSVRTFPKYGGNAFLHSPLRWACIETTQEEDAMEFLETIRDIDPTQFLFQDSHGQLPIDGECVLDASLKLLLFLLNIYLDYDFVCPNGVGMLEANFNPITCLCGSYWSDDIQKATEEIQSGERTVTGENVVEDNLGIEDTFWKKIILLAKAFYHKTIDEECDGTSTDCNSSTSMLRISNEYADRRIQFRLLHACAGIDWFPPNILRLLVAAFPEALLEEDEDGNLPVHIASGGFFESYKIIDANNWDSGDLEANSGYQKTTIDIFLEANPTLASIPDAEGRLPLELALESGNTLANFTHHKRWRPWEDGGIGSLLDAFPEAARIRSPVTGKLPLEITLGKGSYRDWEDGVQALLAAYPEAARTKILQLGNIHYNWRSNVKLILIGASLLCWRFLPMRYGRLVVLWQIRCARRKKTVDPLERDEKYASIASTKTDQRSGCLCLHTLRSRIVRPQLSTSCFERIPKLAGDVSGMSLIEYKNRPEARYERSETVNMHSRLLDSINTVLFVNFSNATTRGDPNWLVLFERYSL